MTHCSGILLSMSKNMKGCVCPFPSLVKLLARRATWDSKIASGHPLCFNIPFFFLSLVRKKPRPLSVHRSGTECPIKYKSLVWVFDAQSLQKWSIKQKRRQRGATVEMHQKLVSRNIAKKGFFLRISFFSLLRSLQLLFFLR